MKKLFAILVLLSGASGSAFAQLFGTGIFSSSNQQLVEKAVQDGIVLLRQEYQLEDTLTMKRYAWDNRPEFGSAVSMCVLTENGYIVSDRALHPWEYDPRFEQYRNTKYRPVLSKTGFRTVADSVYRAAGRPEPQCVQPLSDKGWVHAADSLFGCKGFTFDRTAGEKDGWLVWLASGGSGETDSEELSLVIYRHKLVVEEGTESYDIPAPNSLLSMTGGIYIVPQYTGIGEITFALVGAVAGNEGKWQMMRVADIRPADDSSDGADDAADSAETGGLSEALTPVQPGNGNFAEDDGGNVRKTKKQKK